MIWAYVGGGALAFAAGFMVNGWRNGETIATLTAQVSVSSGALESCNAGVTGHQEAAKKAIAAASAAQVLAQADRRLAADSAANLRAKTGPGSCAEGADKVRAAL